MILEKINKRINRRIEEELKKIESNESYNHNSKRTIGEDYKKMTTIGKILAYLTELIYMFIK